MKFRFVLLFGALFTAVAPSFAEAKNRPTVSTVGDCFNDPEIQYDCDGTLCSCCYDDGCWICNAGTPSDCEWEGRYRLRGTTGDRPDISPGKPPKPKLNVPELLQQPQIAPR